MRCGYCQFENRESVRFCEECGAKLEVICPACGAAIPPAGKFCGGCGQPLAPAATEASKFGSPGSYTPKRLAEKILTSRAALEGERKQVTVLFADLKGSMELLADRDPEEARTILDPVLARMMEAVHRYEGTVNQVMGDGIMALFGAPLAHEDHAVRACYAALRMQELVRRYAEDARRAHGVNVQIRVGLNSGEVVVRAIGSDLHMDYTAVGQTTHLAARMEQLASPGSVLLTLATLELVGGYVDVRPLGPVPVKGLADPVEVYEVSGAGPARTRFQAAARRGLTRFVGRDAELEQLRHAQRLAGHGHGQVAAIVGILTTTYLEQAHCFRGEYERVVELATANLAALPADWVYEYFGNTAPASVYDRRMLIESLAELGRFAEAAEYQDEVIRLAEPTHHAGTIGMAYYAAGMLHLLKGDWVKARSLLEHGLAVFRTGNVVMLLRTTVASSAWVMAQLDEPSEALNRLREGEQLLERFEVGGIVGYRGWASHALGRACLLLGRLDEARSLGERAVESSPHHHGFVAHAQHLLGDIATHPDRFDAGSGEAHYRRALALAEPRGMRPLVAHCHLGLGKLYARTGKREQAQEHLATATTSYRAMDMGYWLTQAEAETRELA